MTATLASLPFHLTGLAATVRSSTPHRSYPVTLSTKTGLPVVITLSTTDPGHGALPLRGRRPLRIERGLRRVLTLNPGVRTTTEALNAFREGGSTQSCGSPCSRRAYRAARRGWCRITSPSLSVSEA